MALTKEDLVVALEITGGGQILIKRRVSILEDGTEILSKNKRNIVIVPEDADANTPAVQNIINQLLDNARALAARQPQEIV